MATLFSAPKAPPMPPMPAPPPPVPDVASIQKNTEDEDALDVKRQGRASTLLTGSLGDTSIPQTASKTLLGQ